MTAGAFFAKNGGLNTSFSKADTHFHFSHTVAGCTISLPNYDDQLLVHDGDTFLELQEAFDAGLLTRQDIRLIQKYSHFR